MANDLFSHFCSMSQNLGHRPPAFLRQTDSCNISMVSKTTRKQNQCMLVFYAAYIFPLLRFSRSCLFMLLASYSRVFVAVLLLCCFRFVNPWFLASSFLPVFSQSVLCTCAYESKKAHTEEANSNRARKRERKHGERMKTMQPESIAKTKGPK